MSTVPDDIRYDVNFVRVCKKSSGSKFYYNNGNNRGE